MVGCGVNNPTLNSTIEKFAIKTSHEIMAAGRFFERRLLCFLPQAKGKSKQAIPSILPSILPPQNPTPREALIFGALGGVF